MTVWNYIGEFFLFRRLFGSRKHNGSEHEVSNPSISPVNRDLADDIDSYIGYENRYDNSYPRYDNQDYGDSQSYYGFHDEQDDYDMTDDDF